MASVFTLEGPSLAKVPQAAWPTFVEKQPRLLQGAFGSRSQWPQILRGALGGKRRPKRCVSTADRICREDWDGSCQCYSSTTTNALRGPGGLDLLGLPPALGSFLGFVGAAAVGVGLGVGVIYAQKKLKKSR